MASLFELLRETMPISAATFAANWGRGNFRDLEVADMAPFLRYLEPDESYESIVPPIKELNYRNSTIAPLQRLWAWKHNASDPATITDVWCRARDAGFLSQKVFDSIEWGHEVSGGEFKKCVRATLMSGKEVELPLTPRFAQAKWLVTDGAIQEDQTPLWKLQTRLDKGLVIAFVYEIGEDGEPQPWQPGKEDKKAMDAALELSKGRHAKKVDPPNDLPLWPESPQALAASDSESPLTDNSDYETWGKRINKGDLMPRAEEIVVSGQIPSVQVSELGPGRILVVLSLTLCREKSDFFPGDVFGMARFYPHLMLMSSVPLLELQASIRYNRPLKTTIADPSDGIEGAKPICHNEFDVSNGFISSIMVADGNDSSQDLGISAPLSLFVNGNQPMPFWSYLFSYYLPHAYESIGAEAMRVVRTDRPKGRAQFDNVIRQIEQGNSAYDILWKEPRQGEFDNIHLAPSLKLSSATQVGIPDRNWFTFIADFQKIDITDKEAHEFLKLDDISMAPFCVHDCVHTHWRWGMHLTSKPTLGWDETGPNMRAGAPQVPLNQDVFIWLRAPSLMTYGVRAGNHDASLGTIEPGAWQVIMHHGSGYAVYVSDPDKVFKANTGIDALTSGGWFYKEERAISSFLSHATGYWHMRYVLESQDGIEIPNHWQHLEARERTVVKSMREARDF